MLFFIDYKLVVKDSSSGFQYISCYSLSIRRLGLRDWKQVSIHLMLFFIQTHLKQHQTISFVSIHLMLFFIETTSTPVLLHNTGFNTSHVILYQKKNCIHICCIMVSIHLMLFFIMASMGKNEPVNCFNTSHVILYLLAFQAFLSCLLPFQYISCYSLSETPNRTATCEGFQYISCYSLSLDFPIFSMPIFFIIAQNTRICNIFPR